MGKFVGGLITGSVLTLVGIGIAAAISDGTLSNPLDSWGVLSGDEENDEDDDTDDSESSKDDIVDEATKTGGMLGRGLGTILNAAAAGAESFEKGLSEEVEQEEDSSDEDDTE